MYNLKALHMFCLIPSLTRIGILQSKISDPYATLLSWFSENMASSHEELRNSTVVFGPGESFYARTPKGCVWNNLPNDLETQIIDEMGEEGRGPPKSVTLGMNRTWMAFWNDGIQSWNLRGHYDVVNECLNDDSKARGGIVSVTLSPYNDNFFIHHRDGFLRWKFGFDDEKLTQRFRKMCYTYMQTRAREDDTTFRFQNWIDNSPSKSSVVISPTTNFDEWDGRLSGSLTGISRKTLAIRPLDHPMSVIFGATVGAGAVFLTIRRFPWLNNRQRMFFKKPFEWIMKRRR